MDTAIIQATKEVALQVMVDIAADEHRHWKDCTSKSL